MESLAARQAISNIGSKDIEEMESTLSKMAKAAKENGLKTYFSHHSRYHEIFFHASKNDMLIEILENLRRQAVWFRFSYLWHQENFEYAIRVHREILDCFIKGDADQAENLVKEHILIVLDRFLQFLREKQLNGED